MIFFVGFDVGPKNASELAAINFATGILIAGGRWTAGPMTWWNNSTEPFLEFRHQVTQTCPASDQRVLLSIIEITQAEERLVLNTARNTVLWLYYLGLFQEQSVFGDLLILPTGEMHRQILKRFVDLRAWMISAGAGMRRILGLGHFSLFAPRPRRWIHRKKKQTTNFLHDWKTWKLYTGYWILSIPHISDNISSRTFHLQIFAKWTSKPSDAMDRAPVICCPFWGLGWPHLWPERKHHNNVNGSNLVCQLIGTLLLFISYYLRQTLYIPGGC